jgi:hypothetical protein
LDVGLQAALEVGVLAQTGDERDGHATENVIPFERSANGCAAIDVPHVVVSKEPGFLGLAARRTEGCNSNGVSFQGLQARRKLCRRS